MNDFTQELDMSELHSRTSSELAVEAALETTIKTGTYHARVVKTKAMRNSDDAPQHPGREFALLTIELFNIDTGLKVGSCYDRVSWEIRKAFNNRLDFLSIAYNNLRKAVGASADMTVFEVLELAKSQTIKVLVVEKYRIGSTDHLHADHSDLEPNTKGDIWLVLETDDDEYREHYLTEGYEPFINVKKYMKA